MPTKHTVTSDSVIETTTTVVKRPKMIQFADILYAVKVEPDDYPERPWDDCDGYEHETRKATSFDDAADVNAMQGYVSGDWRTESKVIVLADGDPWGVGEYARAKGASKQVAAEMVALNKRQTLKQLVYWYEHGWESWYVKCAYFGVSDSCGGFLMSGLDHREDERQLDQFKEEIALNVACFLEERGHIVKGKPDEKQTARDGKVCRLKHNLSLFTWKE